MKLEIFLLISLLIFLVFGCKTKNNTEFKNKDLVVIKDTLPVKIQNTSPNDIPDFHTDHPFFADTRQLRQKRMDILKSFPDSFSRSGSYYDTLVDINYDGYRDYIIGYYGGSGTGFKYKIAAFVFSKKKEIIFLMNKFQIWLIQVFFYPNIQSLAFILALVEDGDVNSSGEITGGC